MVQYSAGACSETMESESEQTSEDTRSDDEERQKPQCSARAPQHGRAFSESQVASLKSYYKRGMVGIGKHYTGLIEAASEETGLTIGQVKVSLELHLILIDV